jgi:hypothetical protein
MGGFFLWCGRFGAWGCSRVRASRADGLMIRITITPAFGTVAVEPERAQDGSVHIWLDPGVLAKLKALRGPRESYSDVILQLAKGDGAR